MLWSLLALLFVQVLFAALPIASKFVLQHANPLFVVVLRSAFGAVFFLALSQIFTRDKKSPEAMSRGTHVELMLLAFFGITFNQVALFVALPHTSASIASIVSPTIAIFTLVFSVWAGREKFEPLKVASVVLGTVGVLLVLASSPADGVAQSQRHASGSLWANSLNLISAASYAYYLARVGSLPSRIGTFRFVFFLFLYGFVMNSVAWAVFYPWVVPVDGSAGAALLFTGWEQLDAPFWSGLAFLLLGATALTYLLNAWALQRVKPSLVGGFVCLQTVFGLALSGLILKESLTPVMILGSIFILAGVLLLSSASTRVEVAAQSDETPTADLEPHATKSSAGVDFSVG